jgi:HAD superfamily hydrolase (TIGR01484 family)
MRPLSELAAHVRSRVRAVLFDIDDTITTDGRLTAEAYGAIERLHQARLIGIPITGRPAGWCDHIARMWPVEGVVGENGAFYFHYDRRSRRMQRVYADDADTRARHRARLSAIASEILQAVPGAAVAADQAYRETDLAIDFCEDVKRLPEAAVDNIVGIMRERGMTVKVSSIHVNGWFGDYDKLTMTRRLMRECHQIDLDAQRDRLIFVGDSPNDAPMFAFFPDSIGVANVREAAERLTHTPAYVSAGSRGAGFREVVDWILEAQREN